MSQFLRVCLPPFENYLSCITENKYKTVLARFRTSSCNLFIETGRYDNSPRNEKLCKSWNMNQIEDEYHFLLVCLNYLALRAKYFKPYFISSLLSINLKKLFSTKSTKLIIYLSKAIYFVTKLKITRTYSDKKLIFYETPNVCMFLCIANCIVILAPLKYTNCCFLCTMCLFGYKHCVLFCAYKLFVYIYR